MSPRPPTRIVARTMVPLLLATVLVACESERDTRPASSEIFYRGYVPRGPTSADEMVEEGKVVFHVADAAIAAEQPYDDYPGYWAATLPAGQSFEVRVETPNAWPALWAGKVPTADASWFSGALFGGDVVQVSDFLAALAAPGHETLSVEDTTVVHVVGSAWDGEAWDCAAVTVGGVAPTCYLQDAQTGTVSIVTEGPLDFFVALDLPPGDILVDSGLGGAHTYATTGGELVYAFWFQGVPS